MVEFLQVIFKVDCQCIEDLAFAVVILIFVQVIIEKSWAGSESR